MRLSLLIPSLPCSSSALSAVITVMLLLQGRNSSPFCTAARRTEQHRVKIIDLGAGEEGPTISAAYILQR